MATRTLTVNLVGRTDKLNRSFKNASRGADTMAHRMQKATRRIGLAFGVIGGAGFAAAAAMKPMIDKAADVQESLSKNTVVFGENAAAVEAFAEKSLQSFGVTRRAALEATGVIGTLGKAMGMTEADSASMATTLTGLAGDMASFNNASVEETLTAIQAGLRGEAEPLRRFGVLLDAATLKAKALEQGIIKNTKDALTPQQKAMAAYAVILEQTAVQMGDFERTSDSATNQSKLLAGEWDNIQTEIGTALLPAFTSIVTHLNESVLPAVRDFWSDPSWFAGGELAGKAAGSGFVQSITSVFGGLSDDEVADLGWQESWRASAELSALAAGASAVWSFIRGVREGMASDPAQEALADAFEQASAAMAGRPLQNADTDTRLTGPPSTGVPSGGRIPGGFEVAPTLPDNRLPGGGRIPGGFEIPAASGPSDSEVMAWLATPQAKAFLGPAVGGPPNTQINIVAPAVSGQEVVDALGQYIDMNGPLGPQFTTQ